MENFWFCFIPIFVAIDPIGILPFYQSFTHPFSTTKKRAIAWQSVFTAFVVTVVFLFIGKPLLRYLGVSVGDFMIAGGSVLFVISLKDLLSSSTQGQILDEESLGAFPIGVPLVAGPALLTTVLLTREKYGAPMTIGALFLALFLTWLFFFFSQHIFDRIGKNGAHIISKIANLLLAAIAVMLMREGLLLLLGKTS
jgi:multiple antibiotic resistance protein